ncbi:hypothetical protein ACTA71_005707 [Dictyostelium dimigraforme]
MNCISDFIRIEYRYLPSTLYCLVVVSLFFYFVGKTNKKRYFSYLFFILSLISIIDIVLLIQESDIFLDPNKTFSGEFGGKSFKPIINETSLHIRCFDYNNNSNDGSGGSTGEKTIIFEAGTPFYSTIWGNVLEILQQRQQQQQQQINNSNYNPMNKIKQYCIYDRYGYGWSDLKYKNNRNKGVQGIEAVKDLKQYLELIGINDHLILVGWSYGGVMSQLFASQFPSSVDGVLLVDSMGLMDLTDTFLAKLINQGITSFKVLKYLLPSGITRILTPFFPLSSGYLESVDLSDNLKYSTDLIYQSFNNIDASKNELSIIFDSINQLNDIITNQNNLFGNSEYMGNKSLVVLTAGENGTPDWINLQFEMTYYSSNSVQIVNNSTDHFVPLHASQSIVNAISLCIVMSN